MPKFLANVINNTMTRTMEMCFLAQQFFPGYWNWQVFKQVFTQFVLRLIKLKSMPSYIGNRYRKLNNHLTINRKVVIALFGHRSIWLKKLAIHRLIDLTLLDRFDILYSHTTLRLPSNVCIVSQTIFVQHTWLSWPLWPLSAKIYISDQVVRSR